LEGVTGNVQFDEDGKRNGFEMEVLNLRNDSFEKVYVPKNAGKRLVPNK